LGHGVGGDRVFESETPADIMSWDVDDVWKLVKDEEGSVFPNPRVRLNYVKMLYDVLGLDLTPDVALASIAMPKALLSISPAGGGKTTWAQVQAILYKLLYPNPKKPSQKVSGGRILCLVYNRHNVQDMVTRHEQMVTRLRLANIKGLDIDDQINASTMHSFCDFIRKKYVAKLNMVGFSLLDDDYSVRMMERSVRIGYKKMKKTVPSSLSVANLLSFYVLCRESMKDPRDMQESDKFLDLGLPLDEIEAVFEQYESAKKIGRRYDYVDMLTSIAGLLERDRGVLEDVQRYFHVIIADEVQDFTPVMWRLLQLFVSDGTPLTCIGDEDQCIYQFRGASIEDLLLFSGRFSGGKVYSLLRNRRCRKEILDEAVHVIGENTLRFNKRLVGTKDGGSVEAVPYNTAEGQVLNIIGRLKQMTPDGRQDTVCCYRDNKNALMLIDMLEGAGIPFYSIQGTKPFSHELYRHVMDVLDALELPYSREASLNLYKVLPCSRKQICDAMGYDAEKRRFRGGDRHLHFAQYDYGSVMGVSGFSEVMVELVKISNQIKTASMSSYVGRIFALLDKYFWNYRKSVRNEEELDAFFDRRVREYFNVDETYPVFFEKHNRRKGICASNNRRGCGVALSTFHGLKGLEFENVFVAFMDDNIFPNFGLIEGRHYADRVQVQLKESETRLWYVVVTRAISNLVIYYSQANPSKYVQDFLDRKRGIYVRPPVGALQGTAGLDGASANRSDSGTEDDFNDDFCESFEDILTEPSQVSPEPVLVSPRPLRIFPEPVRESGVRGMDPDPATDKQDSLIQEAENKRFSDGRPNDFLSRLIASL